MAISAWSATESRVMIDSAEIEGLQSIEFKVNRSRTDIIAVGQPLRQGVEYGVKVINGKLRVKSSCPQLDKKLSEKELDEAKFTLQATSMTGSSRWMLMVWELQYIRFQLPTYRKHRSIP